MNAQKTTDTDEKTRAIAEMKTAITKNDIKRVGELLIEGLVSVNTRDENGDMFVHLAAGMGRTAIMEILYTPNARDGVDNTPLHRSAGGGHMAASKLLVILGENPYAKNAEGRTPKAVAGNKWVRAFLATETGSYFHAADMVTSNILAGSASAGSAVSAFFNRQTNARIGVIVAAIRINAFKTKMARLDKANKMRMRV